GPAGWSGLFRGLRFGRRSAPCRGVCGVRRNSGRHRLGGLGVGRCLRSGGRTRLEFGDTGFRGGELLLQLIVLLVEATQFDDDFVQEVVDLVLVVPIAELDMLEPLVHYVFWRKRHEANLFSTTMWHFDW